LVFLFVPIRGRARLHDKLTQSLYDAGNLPDGFSVADLAGRGMIATIVMDREQGFVANP
jgi:hypothetical protein